MEELAIKRELNEETRRETVWCVMDGEIKCLSLHITGKKEVILTDHSDYSKIYSVQTLEFYQALERAGHNTPFDNVMAYIQNYAMASAAYAEAAAKCQVDGPDGSKIMGACPLEEFKACNRAMKELLRAILDAAGFTKTRIVL